MISPSEALTAPAVTSRVSWDERDTILYALSVGAGRDPACELHLTTENSENVTLRPIPSLAAVLVQRAERPDHAGLDMTRAVHAEQHLTLFDELPATGSLDISTRVTGVESKGDSAIVTMTSTAHHVDGGSLVFESVARTFFRGVGAVEPQGEAPEPCAPLPEASWNRAHEIEMRPDQALLYRLNADRNPLHADPVVARRAGYDRPILHGLATWGSATRILDESPPHDSSRRLKSLAARFTRPVYPGALLELRVWDTSPTSLRFAIVDDSNVCVLDRGSATFFDEETPA